MDKQHQKAKPDRPKAKTLTPGVAKAPEHQHLHARRDKDDLDARLDDALEDTFPASDPIALSNVYD